MSLPWWGPIEQIVELINSIEAEPSATGEPAESVQLGRWQVCDEVRALLDKTSAARRRRRRILGR